MSMLAEPRRKQKWSVDPRNSTWSKDDNKFGQKMLERMGWSKGKGLGRSEQGSTEHIKVKVKNDSHGLGVTASHEDNWIAHQDDFNELLAQLNSCHSQNDSNESPPEEPKGFSLEEKSKTAAKRVHYMKFTKGKDLSSRSEKDLNCIFGKRASSSKEQDQESNSSDSQEEKEKDRTVIAPTELDTETITNTVTSTLTMQEYFAQRMARLKRAPGQALSSKTSEKSNNPTHDGNNCSTEQPKKKKKKKKKDKKAAEEAEVPEKCDALVSEEHKELEQSNSEKKKKKRKIHENEQPMTLEEEMPPSKKKKNKKRKKDTEQVNGHLLAEDDIVQFEVIKTKKHDEVESVFREKKSKKDKKNKK